MEGVSDVTVPAASGTEAPAAAADSAEAAARRGGRCVQVGVAASHICRELEPWVTAINLKHFFWPGLYTGTVITSTAGVASAAAAAQAAFAAAVVPPTRQCSA